MVRLALRLAVSLVAMLVVWTTASVARADAPQCDRRCAVTFAESPALQIRNVSVDVGDADDRADADVGDVYLQEDFPPAPSPSAQVGFDALLPGVVALPARTYAMISWPRTADGNFRAGVVFGLERPPR